MSFLHGSVSGSNYFMINVIHLLTLRARILLWLQKPMALTAISVSEREKLKDALTTMLNHKGSYLLEAMVGKETMYFPMVPQGCSVAEIRLKITTINPSGLNME
jgi:hypothetical protein